MQADYPQKNRALYNKNYKNQAQSLEPSNNDNKKEAYAFDDSLSFASKKKAGEYRPSLSEKKQQKLWRNEVPRNVGEDIEKFSQHRMTRGLASEHEEQLRNEAANVSHEYTDVANSRPQTSQENDGKLQVRHQ